MNKLFKSIPEMLNDEGSISEVARVLGVSRTTVAKYREDTDCKCHIVADGILMSKTMDKPLKVTGNK